MTYRIEFTEEKRNRLEKLTSDNELNNGVSVEESRERTSLIFLKQANMFEDMLEELRSDNIDDEEQKNIIESYEDLIERNYGAYERYSV